MSELQVRRKFKKKENGLPSGHVPRNSEVLICFRKKDFPTPGMPNNTILNRCRSAEFSSKQSSLVYDNVDIADILLSFPSVSIFEKELDEEFRRKSPRFLIPRFVLVKFRTRSVECFSENVWNRLSSLGYNVRSNFPKSEKELICWRKLPS